MSLDVYLRGPAVETECECILCGNIHNHSTRKEFFSANITHNLNRMAEEAGIYEYLWRPDEIGITTAGQLVAPLAVGVELMKSDPARFEKFNAANGWGTYEVFLPWIERYLEACREFPDATVEASR